MATDRGSDRGRSNRPRPARPAGPPRADQPTGEGGAAAPAQRTVPPANYREHLEQEHGLRVVAEPNWPTDLKRWRLVRGEGANEKTLEVYRGTLPEAVGHFYHQIHPQPARR